MSLDGSEGFPIEDPGNKEGLLTKETKTKLVNVLDGWDTIAGEPLHPVLAALLAVEKPENIRYVPLSGRENGVSINIDIFKTPEGVPDDPNRRWAVVLDDPQNKEFESQLLVREIPDGWDVEYHKRKHAADDQMDEEIALATDDAEFIAGMYAKGQARRQQARELGMASVSDQKVRDITKVLREAEKREKPQGE
jgi:hypothetical protein